MNLNQIGHLIKIKYGTGPNEPTCAQVQKILYEIKIEVDAGAAVLDELVSKLVYKYCRTAGTCVYAGEDNSDLNALILQAINSIK